MIIKASQVLVNLQGKNLQAEDGDLTLGKALSNILISTKEGGKMKLFLLGKKLYEAKNVEVDSADLALIKNAVISTEIYTALVSGQCELLLEEVTEIKKNK